MMKEPLADVAVAISDRTLGSMARSDAMSLITSNRGYVLERVGRLEESRKAYEEAAAIAQRAGEAVHPIILANCKRVQANC